jgi:hypothetical protein
MTTSTGSGQLRRVIASYSTYEEAQRAVDTLSDRKFPVEHVAIVGSDLRLVEQVVGRLTLARAALAGAGTGAWFGLLIGLVFWIVSPWWVGAVVSGVLLGLVFGGVVGALAYAASGGRRDFTSLRTLDAGRYDVMVDADHVDEALRVLGS